LKEEKEGGKGVRDGQKEDGGKSKKKGLGDSGEKENEHF